MTAQVFQLFPISDTERAERECLLHVDSATPSKIKQAFRCIGFELAEAMFQDITSLSTVQVAWKVSLILGWHRTPLIKWIIKHVCTYTIPQRDSNPTPTCTFLPLERFCRGLSALFTAQAEPALTSRLSSSAISFLMYLQSCQSQDSSPDSAGHSKGSSCHSPETAIGRRRCTRWRCGDRFGSGSSTRDRGLALQRRDL